MEPVAKWGPKLWRQLEQAAANFPEFPEPARQQEARHMLIGLPALVPCDLCSGHLRQAMLEMPTTVTQAASGRDQLFAYIWLLHEQVNHRLGKRGISLAKLRAKYDLN